ncbi:MAG: hypothetical protein U0531_08195 [Dehalococcoidia bacterium]
MSLRVPGRGRGLDRGERGGRAPRCSPFPASCRCAILAHPLRRRGHHPPAAARIVRRGIVQVPEGRQMLAQMSALENLEMGAISAATGPPCGRRSPRCWNDFPALGGRRDLPAGSLSGGEQQMPAIARALMARPRPSVVGRAEHEGAVARQ